MDWRYGQDEGRYPNASTLRVASGNYTSTIMDSAWACSGVRRVARYEFPRQGAQLLDRGHPGAQIAGDRKS